MLDSNQNTVRIGVNAPKDVSVYREELYKEIKNANMCSNSVSANSMTELHDLIKERKQSFSNSNYEYLTNKLHHE